MMEINGMGNAQFKTSTMPFGYVTCCYRGLLLVIVFVVASAGLLHAEQPNNSKAFFQLLKRVTKGHAADFSYEYVDKEEGNDIFELSCYNKKIHLKGNNNNSLAVCLNFYLRYYCHISVSWSVNDPVVLPAVLPAVKAPVRHVAKLRDRYFLNYCTFGYTLPWWRWKEWQRLIDWMALNGINLPLAVTGQEAIWYRVWKKYGLTDIEIRRYFGGPAHLPWHKMSNIDNWQGPLPLSYIVAEEKLQKLILERERELNMTPVLSAFAGHVPRPLLKRFPGAKISELGEWGGFGKKYRSYFLDPFDSLFSDIQTSFLKTQDAVYGESHIYCADPFNEVAPPRWDTAYLSAVSKTIYSALRSVDERATWIMMSWVFYFERDKWTNDRVRSFVGAVPNGKLILLDYYCENTEVWKLTDAYFGQPFLWCYLGNFGGNTMIAGNIAEVKSRMENAFKTAGRNLIGVGLTPEGFDVNPMMYTYVLEKIWDDDATPLQEWVTRWAYSRAGRVDSAAAVNWQILADSIYVKAASLGQATLTNARPSLAGHGNWTTNPAISYSNALLYSVWKSLSELDSKSFAYNLDIVNIGRQVLGNYFMQVRDSLTLAYYKSDVSAVQYYGARLLDILNDIDQLLSTQNEFLLGQWLTMAKSFARDQEESKYYEMNARTIITTWGLRAQSLNDYGNRAWAGLIRTYYCPRWSLFISDLVSAVKHHRLFDEKSFFEKVTRFEEAWTRSSENFSITPKGSGIQISRRLVLKYQHYISHS